MKTLSIWTRERPTADGYFWTRHTAEPKSYWAVAIGCGRERPAIDVMLVPFISGRHIESHREWMPVQPATFWTDKRPAYDDHSERGYYWCDHLGHLSLSYLDGPFWSSVSLDGTDPNRRGGPMLGYRWSQKLEVAPGSATRQGAQEKPT